MRSGDQGPRPGRPGPRLLYIGVACCALLAVVTSLAIRREWQHRIGQSRADAIFALVQDKTTSRPTETPGVAAWLHLQLKQYRRHIADPGKARLYGEVVDWHDDSTLPAFLSPLRDLLASRPPPPRAASCGPSRAGSPLPPGGGSCLPRLLSPEQAGDEAAGAPVLQFRSQDYVELAGHWFVVTRRKALDPASGPAVSHGEGRLLGSGGGDPASSSDRFLYLAAHRLLDTGEALRQLLARRPLPATPGDTPPRVVRLYAVAEDGTLISEPFARLPADERARRRAALAEGREFRKVPELPSFISNEFVFRFDFNAPRGQSYYSGLYLDLGGQGVVATVTVPARDAASGFQGVLCADLTFGIDWRKFAASIEGPMIAEVVETAEPPRERWRPWSELTRRLGDDAAGRNPRLRAAVAALAAREAGEGHWVSPFYLYHGVVEGQGAVAALQAASTTWLVILFPASRPSFALLPVALLVLLFCALLAGFEIARRRTERAQHKAERELREKQNLLNTMQVPLMVVDPNTDEVIYGNEAAASLGIRAGSCVAEIVADDPRARAHYLRMQSAGHARRRAYGIPVRVRGENGGEETRYAIVRSVAVTAPIEALRADQRHRLGILFLIEPEADLALFSEELVSAAQGDERRKLAGLLSHGVDTLARVLGHCLEGAAEAGDGLGFAGWLADYLERRVLATAWLLEHWDADPPLPPDSSIEAAQARVTIERYCAIFARVREDPRLRSRLHWDNGVLSDGLAPVGPPPEPAPGLAPGPAHPILTPAHPTQPPDTGLDLLSVTIDWPEDFWFACPLRGGFGLFLGEVLINAVKHGAPGSRPVIDITLDRVRKELVFTAENRLRPGDAAGGQAPPAGEETYGGRRILERLARLFDWRDLTFERGEATFLTTWRVPVSQRGDPRAAD
jgi:hypothetical protein